MPRATVDRMPLGTRASRPPLATHIPRSNRRARCPRSSRHRSPNQRLPPRNLRRPHPAPGAATAGSRRRPQPRRCAARDRQRRHRPRSFDVQRVIRCSFDFAHASSQCRRGAVSRARLRRRGEGVRARGRDRPRRGAISLLLRGRAVRDRAATATPNGSWPRRCRTSPLRPT